ncbi:MAG: beta-propeller domain-containing protein [Halococcoides sp.]
MDRRLTIAIAGVAIVGALVAAAVAVSVSPTPDSDDTTLDTFDSAEQFRSYLDEGGRDDHPVARTGNLQVDTGGPSAVREMALTKSTTGSRETRHSRTNVQHRGIAEPDILKTTSRRAYISPGRAGPFRVVRDRTDTQKYQPPNTTVLDTRSPLAPERIGSVNTTGRLLLANETLVALEGDRLVAHDVSDPAAAERRWSHELSGTIDAARRIDDRLLVVVESPVDRSEPCPVEPMADVTVPCGEIHRPDAPVAVETTRTVLSIDLASGEIRDRATVVGTRDSVTYVSEDALYLTDTRERDRSALYIEGLLANARDVLPDETIDRLEQLQSYELSDRTRRIEAERAVESYLQRLPADQRKTTRKRLETAVSQFVADRHRTLVETGIVRIAHGGGLQVTANGTVPGRPVDQFALDATNESLRISTTVPAVAGVNSTNDLYTLDRETLDRRGSVQGLSPGQEIFAARYVNDTAYLVTFRQVDPFHVIDLSDPDAPRELGQVQLPGFSTYLHPVGPDRILGVGEQNGRVKATLFSASDPTDPRVVSNATFDARWSAVRESHHAFLQDRRHGVVVVPAGNTAHVLSYEDGLTEVAAIETDGRVRRAAYVGNALYVVSTSEVVVVDERDWSIADRIDLPTPPERVIDPVEPLPGPDRAVESVRAPDRSVEQVEPAT